MQTANPVIEKALLAALSLSATKRWPELTQSAISNEAALALSDFHSAVSEDSFAAAADAHFDRAMSAEGANLKGPARERLFDVIMLRFEAMEPHRSGLLSLLKFRDASLRALMRLPETHLASARWALTSAGLDTEEGAPLGLKTLAIANVIRETERAWRKEASGDFALTMVALDKSLRDAEERMGWLSRWRRSRSSSKNLTEPQPE